MLIMVESWIELQEPTHAVALVGENKENKSHFAQGIELSKGSIESGLDKTKLTEIRIEAICIRRELKLDSRPRGPFT